jgi:hypothetical protein
MKAAIPCNSRKELILLDKVVKSENANDIMKNKEYKDAKTELPEKLFAKNE